MLAKQDLKLTYMIFSLYSAINFLPFKIDTESFRWTKQPSNIRLYMWKLNMSVGFTYFAFMNLYLIKSMLNAELLSFSNFPLHFGSATGILFIIASYHTYLTRGQSTTLIANEVRDISCSE